MKILICAFACLRDPDRRFGFGEGGEGVLGWNIVLQLSRFFNVSVLTHSTNQEVIENTINKKNIPNIKFYYIDLPKFLNFTKRSIQIYAYLWQMKAYFVAKKLHKEIHFDVFHHATYSNDWMASFIGALLLIPYIRGPGGGAHRVPKNFLEEYSFKERFAEKIRSLGQWVFRHDPFFVIGQSRAKAILVCNRESFDALPKKWQKKASLFPMNGITSEDLLEFDVKLENKGDKFLILSAGKLIKIKGFDLAIKAFKIFSDKIVQTNLVIAGEGPELQNLKKLASELNLEGKIIFIGWVPREKLLQKMFSCDLFLFASLRDGGGNVVVEAMAAGKPVVCFNIAGPGFHIDESCGIKIKPKDPEQAIRETASALEELYFNKDLRSRLGDAARKKAEKEYSWDKLGERFQKIYQKIL